MAFSIVVRLRSGRYEAASIRPQTPEWPPAPARVFCALVASAETDEDWAALNWLESAGQPHILAHPSVATSSVSSFVVTNKISPKGGSQSWPGRTSLPRHKVSTVPAGDAFAIVWPHADPSNSVLGTLLRLASRVPYVGRSTSTAHVSVEPQEVEVQPGWQRWEPTNLGAEQSLSLPVPYRGYTDRLREHFALGERAWEAAKVICYHLPEQVPNETLIAGSPYPRLVVFGFRGGRAQVHSSNLLGVTDLLRQAVNSRVQDAAGPEPIPAQVSGHGADQQRHVAFIALPNVGNAHADGHLLGVAVAIPQSLPDTDRKMLLRALLAPPMTYLSYGGGAHRGFDLDSGAHATWGLQPTRWTAGPAGSARWATATPMMLDHTPRGAMGIYIRIAESLVRAGYPDPTEIEISDDSALRGGPRRLDLSTLSAKRARRRLVHCTVTFPQPVHGLVVAGALRYLGGGLFSPLQEDPTDVR